MGRYSSRASDRTIDACGPVRVSLESAHAVAQAMEETKKHPKEYIIVVNLSGRGDKDLGIVFSNLKVE